MVWLEREGASAHTLGLTGSLAKLKDAQRVSIADVQLPLATPRGNLALGSEDRQFVAFSRGKSTACADQTQRDCIGYSFFRFDGESPRRSWPPLAVPAPCAHDAPSFALSGARWYYGVCSADSGSRRRRCLRSRANRPTTRAPIACSPVVCHSAHSPAAMICSSQEIAPELAASYACVAATERPNRSAWIAQKQCVRRANP